MNLIEIMVVMVIMAMIAAATAVGVVRSLATAKKHDTETRARTIQQAVTGYILEGNEDCPDVDALMRADVLDRTTDPTDAWGNDFHVECDQGAVHVRSAGPDETFGNADDIGF